MPRSTAIYLVEDPTKRYPDNIVGAFTVKYEAENCVVAFAVSENRLLSIRRFVDAGRLFPGTARQCQLPNVPVEG